MTELMTIPQRIPSPADLIAGTDLADSTKTQYLRALEAYLATGASLTDAVALGDYAAGLPTSARSFLKAAVGRWADRMTVLVKAQATPDNLSSTQAAVLRLEALSAAIDVKPAAGTRAHTWLSARQVKQLLATCNGDGLMGQRDRIVLGLMVCAGLRRAEAAAARFEDLVLKPIGDRFRTVIAVRGKGDKGRQVPLSDAFANAIDQWGQQVGPSGRIARRLGRDLVIGDRLSAVAIFNVVRKRGAQIDRPELAAHDLRRTFAQLGYEAGVPITQISTLLGHADVATTQRYLNLELDLQVTASDFVPW